MYIKVGIVVFPGSNCDRDVYYVFKDILKVDAELVWHKRDDLRGYDAIILPGGFAYADRLRAGVIAAHSPVMQEVKRLAKDGLPILGICNGFQVLVEAQLLPGAFMRNDTLKFICRWVDLKVNVDSNRSPFTTLLSNNQVLKMPIANQEGKYYVDDHTLEEMRRNRQIVLTYTSNPNGSLHSIASICNEQGNVMGIMPHPERASDHMLSPYNTNDGLFIFKSILEWLKRYA